MSVRYLGYEPLPWSNFRLVVARLPIFLAPDDVRVLLQTLAGRFPRSEMAFDVIPTGFSQRSLKGKAEVANFTFPPMPWALNYHRGPNAFFRVVCDGR